MSHNSNGYYNDPTAEAAIANITRKEQGLLNRRAGEIFEDMIETSLEWYREKGFADVEKTPEPIKQLSKLDSKGRFLACYEKAAQPDFKGTLIGGRSIVFEAKHTDDNKIAYGRVTPEQAKRLHTHYNMGAAAFVMVSLGLNDFYRVPWEVWRNMKEIFGRMHMKQPELEPYRIEYIYGVLKLLDGIETKYNGKGATQ